MGKFREYFAFHPYEFTISIFLTYRSLSPMAEFFLENFAQLSQHLVILVESILVQFGTNYLDNCDNTTANTMLNESHIIEFIVFTFSTGVFCSFLFYFLIRQILYYLILTSNRTYKYLCPMTEFLLENSAQFSRHFVVLVLGILVRVGTNHLNFVNITNIANTMLFTNFILMSS